MIGATYYRSYNTLSTTFPPPKQSTQIFSRLPYTTIKEKNEVKEKGGREKEQLREVYKNIWMRDKSIKVGGKLVNWNGSRLARDVAQAVHPAGRAKIEGRFPVPKSRWISARSGAAEETGLMLLGHLNLRAASVRIPKIGRTVRQLARLTSSFIVANSVRLTVDPSVH